MKLFVTALSAAALFGAAQARAQTDPHSGAAAQAYLLRNSLEPGVKTLPSGVQYKVVKTGPATGPHPTLNDEVRVNYEVRLTSGEVIDSSYERHEPTTMGLGGLIPAWREAMPLMHPGDEWMLWVPPRMGYGVEGKGPVPPNAVLVFRIELLGVNPSTAR